MHMGIREEEEITVGSGGSVLSGDISASAYAGSAGFVHVTAANSILVGTLTASAGDNAGDIAMTSGTSISAGDINTQTSNRNNDVSSGNVTMIAAGNISTGNILSAAIGTWCCYGNGGNVVAVSTGGAININGAIETYGHADHSGEVPAAAGTISVNGINTSNQNYEAGTYSFRREHQECRLYLLEP